MADAYKTRQRTLVLSLLERMGDRHLTVDEIVVLLSQEGNPVGKTTVYRSLERLIEQGSVRKYSLLDGSSSCYQHQMGSCQAHYHLKCANCGALSHLTCKTIDRMGEHLKAEHGFVLDPSKIVLYGLCAACATEKETHP